MSIVAVGSVAFDTIASPSGKVEGVLGGAATYFALAASYFTDVRVVAIVGEDFSAEHESVLKKRGRPRFGAVKELIRDHEIERPVFFLEGSHRAERQDAFHAERLHTPDVGAKVQLRG